MQANPEALLPQTIVKSEPWREVLYPDPSTNFRQLILQHELASLHGLTRGQAPQLDFKLIQAVNDRVQPGSQLPEPWSS